MNKVLTLLLKKSSMTSSKLWNMSPSSAKGFGILNFSWPSLPERKAVLGATMALRDGRNADADCMAATIKMALNIEDEDGMVGIRCATEKFERSPFGMVAESKIYEYNMEFKFIVAAAALLRRLQNN